ncbi:MAG: DNA translocase FtsK [Candidatus Pacebacteria bacterium]|jgi:S-DNA-T family DNA segregation ATPase FtsK/SpoIIIE|nr:DNA translocase FtsK [Candidatus Paceibacterota bacterium]MDD4994518.1 DNA translocase FtsK [Candidatus Paceibacterota bacterium]MDD5535293.1 DNA translocase FtsK [Candidatus Paceibacterota bacterium]
MSKKKKNKFSINFLGAGRNLFRKIIPENTLNTEVKNSIFAILFLVLSLIFVLSAFHLAGPFGEFILKIFDYLLGWGYFILPFLLILISFNFLRSLTEKINLNIFTFFGCFFVLLSILSISEIFLQGKGGLIGSLGGLLERYLGLWATLITYTAILISGFLLILNIPIKFFSKAEKENAENSSIFDSEEVSQKEETTVEREPLEKEETQEKDSKEIEKNKEEQVITNFIKLNNKYKLPPLNLLDTEYSRPRVGDIKINANIIKRTLQSFGIEVEMGEVNVGPTVTQYTLKPAEGVKLSNITTLQNDLSLALAAHPLRIEAPIPGRSLVGIEVPNKYISLVRLGSLLKETNFQKVASPLSFVLGRNVKGEVLLTNLSKMPHLLIAGATGAGKSVCIHSILTSFLFRNSPETLRLILIDPKRVELSSYNGISHLITPVVTNYKKVLPILRWAVNEMERRYELLSSYQSRDIESFNSKVVSKKEPILPYIVIFIDELADLMVRYGRDLETLIVKIAQMARATGIHLVLSTQRPSVEVITGLIKANITSRIAFQVASQVDSRTILDMGGAEKLLGNGDMLYLASDSSKPRRIQSAYVSEKEINRLIDFIKEASVKLNEENGLAEDLEGFVESSSPKEIDLEKWDKSAEDELYPEAYEIVVKAGKASASLLQRRLRIGYARAARLLDILEENEVVGPVDGAKPREVFIKEEENNYDN